ncbi:MAG: hypothetical protein ABIK62_04335 [candidate division WOR-3 bacterium]
MSWLLSLLAFGTTGSIPDLAGPLTRDELMSLGESLYQASCYYEAATEFERLLFLDSVACTVSNLDSGRATWRQGVRYRILQCYARLGNLDWAEEVAAKIVAGAGEGQVRDSLTVQVGLQLAKAYAYWGRSYQARAELLGLLALTKDPNLCVELNRRLAALDLHEFKFAQAEQHFARAGDSARARACARFSGLPQRDPELASMMSGFIPGLGEVYAGDVKVGIRSFAANALVFGAVLYSLAGRHYVDAALLVTVLGGRFYFGSQQQARDLAEESNRRQFLDAQGACEWPESW